jgi:hypothetical protein
VFGGWSLSSIKCPEKNGDPQLHWQEVADFKYSFADLRFWSLKKKLPWS